MIGTRYPHFGRYAGIGQFARHLPALGYGVDCRAVPDDDSALPIPIPMLRDRLRARVQRSGMAWYKLSDLSGEVRALAAAATRRAQIVHFLDGEHGVQFLPGWLKRLPGRRPSLVASFHQPAAMLPGLVSKEVVRELDAVVLMSDTQLPYFADLLPPDRVLTILHGIDTDHFHPGPGSRDGIIRCVTAGHWLRDWGAMLDVTRAFRDTSKIEFHILTNRPTGLEDMPNVRHHRDLSDGELASLYGTCDIGLLPLVDSTANNSLLEFLASGLPLISTALPSVQAYAGEDAAILLQPGDRAGLIAAVRLLAEQPELRSRIGKAARHRAEQLGWPVVAKQHATLYDRLLAATARVPA